MKYMPERRLICELGKKMWEKGWVAANDGNLSMKAGPDRFLVTPTGVSKGAMTPDMILLVDGQGEKLDEGNPWETSSELGLHLMCYEAKAGVGGVCHAHSPAATAFACARKPLQADCLGEAVMVLGAVPCTTYARTGSSELPKAVRPHILANDAVLIANHGAVTLGRTLEEAYYAMERLEHTALVSLYTGLLGGGVPLSPEEQKDLRR